MTTPRKQSGTESGRAWTKWIFWIFAGVALLLLVLEHRAHVLGWGLHALLGLCVVLLYLAVRANGRSGGDGLR
jgi:cell division protein FtsW (lipid II flippase)